MTTKSVKKKRNALWAINPHCTYCGVLTVRIEDSPVPTGTPTPMNMATLDHVYHINHPGRSKEEYVLSCHECNAIKSMVECHENDLLTQKEKTIKKIMIINRMLEFEKEAI
jgi:5-methylcytosine-specific restriction endonuclease McrA